MRALKILFWACIGTVLLLASIIAAFSNRASAATNISSTVTEHFAWNDTMGWIDFYTPNTVWVWGYKVEGYASSSVGDVSLDCTTTRNGNICATSNYGICNGVYSTSTGCTADASGDLSGYAWNDTMGWISFSCYNHGNCSPSYGVSVNGNTGEFSGYAWNDTVGWISFNYTNPGSPTSTTYFVNTNWRATSSIGYIESATVDTQVVGGATLNSITWKGTKSANGVSSATYVDFQVAASNSSAGPWTFEGPDGSETDYYGASCSDAGFTGGTAINGADPDVPICINPAQVANYRYLRYKVRLRSNLIQNDTPRVDDVILNWSI
ncbi:MAG: hypothetical protein Q7R98_03490 [Candidatus Jorgensenbacteria bacterium]|nr:hypothetical protein [Candidatus Jorgensenbacteria bacterium]